MTALSELARILDDAARTATAVPQLTEERPSLTVEDAYAIQALSIARRYDRGERRVGIKMGLTSRAKMQQVGVSEAVWGRLTNAMRLVEGGDLVRARLRPSARRTRNCLYRRQAACGRCLARRGARGSRSRRSGSGDYRQPFPQF